MPPVLGLAILFAILAAGVLWWAARMRRSLGIPTGRVVYSDTGHRREIEKPLFDPKLGLAGKPDYLIEQDGVLIPVEIKSTWSPSAPYESHIFQLAAYCHLVYAHSGTRPPYGIIRYRNRSFAIDYTPELEDKLQDLISEMRFSERRGQADRSHEDYGRCARCGFRSRCDQKLH